MFAIMVRRMSLWLGVFVIVPMAVLAQQTLNDGEMKAIMRENLSQLIYMVRVQNVDSLKAFYDSLPVHDVAIRVAYATRLLDLENKPSNEKTLLEALPTDELQCTYMYKLTRCMSGDRTIDSALSDVVYELPERAARALLSNHECLNEFLQFGYETDGRSRGEFCKLRIVALRAGLCVVLEWSQ